MSLLAEISSVVEHQIPLSTACSPHLCSEYIVLNLIECEMQNAIQNWIFLIIKSQIYVKNQAKACYNSPFPY